MLASLNCVTLCIVVSYSGRKCGLHGTGKGIWLAKPAGKELGRPRNSWEEVVNLKQ
jgi:hypothetical protein